MGLFQITAVPQNWVTQFSICGHDTQTFTSEYNLKLLGLFADIRNYEVSSNVLRVQLSTSSSQISEPPEPVGSSHVWQKAMQRDHQLGKREIWLQGSWNKPIRLSTSSSPHLCRWHQDRQLWSWFCLEVPTGPYQLSNKPDRHGLKWRAS